MKLMRGKKITISVIAVLLAAAIIITTITVVLSYRFNVVDTISSVEAEEKVDLSKTTLKEAVDKMNKKYEGYGDKASDYWHFYIYGTKEQVANINIEDEEYVKYSYTVMELNDDTSSDIIGRVVRVTDNRSYSGKIVDTTVYPIYVYAFSPVGNKKKAKVDREKINYFEIMQQYSGKNGQDKVCFVADNKLVGVASISSEVKSVKYHGETLKVPVIKYHYSNLVEDKNGGAVKSVKIGSNFIIESGIRPIYESNKIYIADDEIGYKTTAITSTCYKTVSSALFDDVIQGSGYDAMEFCVAADVEQYGITVYYAEILSNDQDENHVNKIAAGDLVIEINGREYGVGLHYEGIVKVA